MRINNIEDSERPALEYTNDISKLSETQKEYIKELDISSSDWNSLLPEEKTGFVSDITERLEEIGISDFEGQAKALRECGCSPELLDEFCKTEHLEEGIFKQYEGQEGLDWLKENNTEAYEMVNRLFTPGLGRAFEDKDYWLKSFNCKELENGDIEISMTNHLAVPSKIRISGDEVYANSGCIKDADSCAPNMFLDEAMPNKTYHIDGNSTFKIDYWGRTVFAEQDRTEPINDTKTDLDQDRRNVLNTIKGGLDSSVEDAGLILQKNQGGINECINLMPMESGWQRPGGKWRALEAKEEKIISEAQANGAQSIISRRHLNYEGDSQRPSSITFETIVDGKKLISENIECPSSKR